MSGDTTISHENTNTTYVAVAVAIFSVVSFTFLFPCNYFFPLDRRTIAVVGALACYLSRQFMFPSHAMDVIAAIDFEVLILLSSIMIINHIIIHLRETKNLIEYFQSIIHHNPKYGFWLLSFVAFTISPFLTNDGVCLLFVEPVLHVFEEVKRKGHASECGDALSSKHDETVSRSVKKLCNSDALYFLLALACSTNIGSALTYTGNPQNMIVASDALGVMPSYKFLAYMLVPSLVTWFITIKWIEGCWLRSRQLYDNPEMLNNGEFDLEESNPINGEENADEVLERLASKDAGDCDTNHDAFTDPSVDNVVPVRSSKAPSSLSPALTSSSKKGIAEGSQIQSDSAAGEALSPRRKLAREREKTEKKVVRYVTSPVPYIVVVMLFLMIVMVFIDVMPIASLICLASILMVLVVVLGNHWRNKVIWEMENEYDYYYQPLLAALSFQQVSPVITDKPADSSLTNFISPAPSVVGYKRDHSKSYRHLRAPSNASLITKDGAHGEEEKQLELSSDSGLDRGHHRQQSQDSSHHSHNSSLHLRIPTQTPPDANTIVGKSKNHELEPLGPMTREDRLDNLNEFFDAMFGSIDYSLLLIFLGTFIVVENMSSTGIPRQIWKSIVGDVPFKTFSSVIGISAFILIASQLLGNVAVIQLAKPNIEYLDDDSKRFAWALISFIATIGGNLTITGSAANIIVAEKANRLDPTICMDFFRHYRVCFWVTLFSCFIGGSLVSIVVSVDNASGSNW